MGSSAPEGTNANVLSLCEKCYHDDYILLSLVHVILGRNDTFSSVFREHLIDLFNDIQREREITSDQLLDVDFDRLCYNLCDRIDQSGVPTPEIYDEFKQNAELAEVLFYKKFD